MQQNEADPALDFAARELSDGSAESLGSVEFLNREHVRATYEALSRTSPNVATRVQSPALHEKNEIIRDGADLISSHETSQAESTDLQSRPQRRTPD